MWGTFLRCSDDFGRIWTNPLEASIRFPVESGNALKNIWQFCLGRADEPDALYCGVEPAALFESRDAGESWSLVRALYDHPHRPRWMPSNGGLFLHTIVPDACIKSCCTNRARSDCSCKTTGGCIVQTTAAIRGRTSRAACLRTLVSRC